MATFAVGDIHGNLPALRDLLGQLQPELASGDTIVFLGDYIDRGPDSKRCVDALLAFAPQVACEVVFLLGNHEEWLLKTHRDFTSHSWLLGMEAFDTIRSYSADAEHVLRGAIERADTEIYNGRVPLPYDAFFDQVPAAHLQFFTQLRSHYRSPDCVCVHAGVDPRIATLESQPRHALVWGVPTFPARYRGREVVVYGHHNNATLDADEWPSPTVVGPTIGIDTIAHGVLTAIRLPDRRVWQSARHLAFEAEL
ncbi:MAG TPA: metallophosphoesterase [Vicinamibacterales bacterium]